MLRFHNYTTVVLSCFIPKSRTMSYAAKTESTLDVRVKDFQRYLESSDRILALLGAGLSASSGLPTFRGAGGMWKNHKSTSLATPQAFRNDPGLVWQFYSYRRHMALQAKPNRAHYALAELARRKKNFITLTQNVDGRLCSFCYHRYASNHVVRSTTVPRIMHYRWHITAKT